MSHPIRCFDNLAECCVFVKQSLNPIYCGLDCSRHPFSRSYGANLPSSLERFNLRALEYSSIPPVSVYGTGTLLANYEVFLGSRASTIPISRGFKVPSFFSFIRYFIPEQPTNLDDDSTRRCLSFLRHSIGQTQVKWCWNIEPAWHRLFLTASS